MHAMRFVLILGVLLSRGASAAQTFTVPIQVVPGTVRILPNLPAGMPFSLQVASAACPGSAGTFSAAVVNGGLEVEFSGSVFAGPENDCPIPSSATMEIELVVAEVGGTATMMRVDGVPVTGSFSSIYRANANISLGASATTSSTPARLFVESSGVDITWNSSGGPGILSGLTALQKWIPGDTVRLPVTVSVVPTAGVGQPTQGTFRARWIFKVTVPEPGASLSLPIGALGLAGLATRRASGG